MAGFFRNMFTRSALPKGDIVPMSVEMKAKALVARGDHRVALEVYEAFLQSHPQSALALNNAADLCLELKNPKRACQLLERAIRLDPKYIKAWNNLGSAKMILGDAASAVEVYKKALIIDPHNTIARAGLKCAEISAQLVKSWNTGTTPKMKALLGTKWGPSHECLAFCIKCGQPIVFLLPGEPIRGQRAQCVNKHQCTNCGLSLYATVCITGQAVLAAGCSIVNNQMQFENPVELEIDDAGGLTFSGNKLDATPLVVGRGKDGNMTLLSPEDLGLSQY